MTLKTVIAIRKSKTRVGLPAQLQIVPRERTLALALQPTHGSYQADAGLVARVFFALLSLELLLVVFDITINYNAWISAAPMRRLFNIAREDSLAAWLSSVQTFFVGFVLLAIHWTAKARGATRFECYGWALLSAFFFYLALDDGSGLHERVGSAFRSQANEVGFPTYAWHMIYGPLFAGAGLFMVAFLSVNLNNKSLRIWFLAALSCYVTAEVLDFIEGLEGLISYESLAQATGLSTILVSHTGRVIEEFLEIFGTTLFLVTFMKHLLGWIDRTVFAFRA